MSLRALVDGFLGRGEAAVTVPVFDGVLKPNDRLEEARAWLTLAAPGDLATDGGALWVADGARVLAVSPEAPGATEVLSFPAPVTALARIAGGFAVALGGTRIEVHGGALDGQVWTEAAGRPFVCVNALAADGQTLIASDGSATNAPDAWQRDLMEKRRQGRVVRLSAQGAQVLSQGLAHGFGIAAQPGGFWVAESWAHRLVDQTGRVVLGDLPGYPSRLAPAQGGAGGCRSLPAGRSLWN